MGEREDVIRLTVHKCIAYITRTSKGESDRTSERKREKRRDRESNDARQRLNTRLATERRNGRTKGRRRWIDSERVPSVCCTRESTNSSHSIGLERPWIYRGRSTGRSEIALVFHDTSWNAPLNQMNAIDAVLKNTEIEKDT